MDTYLFEKIPGGARIQKNSDKKQGVAPGTIHFTDSENDGSVSFTARGIHHKIYVSTDTVIIDETGIGGQYHNYSPATITADDLQKYVMNILNPNSNYIMP